MIVESGCLVRSCYLSDHVGKEAQKWSTVSRKRSIYIEWADIDAIVNNCIMSKWYTYKDTSILYGMKRTSSLFL